MTAALPLCPLCGKDAERYPRSKQIRCKAKGCLLFGVGWFPEAEWRRLASPALAPSAAAVLEAIAECYKPVPLTDPPTGMGWMAEVGSRERVWQRAVDHWIADGKPGLPRAGAGKEGE